MAILSCLGTGSIDNRTKINGQHTLPQIVAPSLAKTSPPIAPTPQLQRQNGAAKKLMPITVLRHRERPRGEGARSFRSAAEWVEARSSDKTPTLKPHGTADNKLPDNSNAKPQRSKVSFAGNCRRSGKQASPYSSTEKTSVWLTRSSSSCSAAISSATAR